jgi:CubicO group peptidase (beta-lactamase class C family)
VRDDANREQRIEALLWPFVERVVENWAVPGVALCVVHDGDQLVARGFGTQDRAKGAAVTPDTLFHLASVSKTFVATAALQMVEVGELDLDACITSYLPDLPWADPRASRITLRHLLSHQSGIGDVSDYGWHEPELDDQALARFASRVSGWQLEHEPGTQFAYSNAGYELLGHLVATLGGQPFEALLKKRVLDAAGMATSSFLRADIPPHLAASPHLGLPPHVVDGTYPYTRPHAPSSSLHSSAAELGRWIVAHLSCGAGLMSPATHELMWEPRVKAQEFEWHEQMALGWFWGTHRGRPVVSHSGSDPGFQTNLALLPELGLGVAVLSNCNSVPVFGLTRAVLDVLLGQPPSEPPLPPVTVPLGPVLEESGVSAAADLYSRLAAADPLIFDMDEDAFENAVWGVIEMHRTDLAWPLLELWLRVQPDSSLGWSTTGWAYEIDGHRQNAVEHLQRAVELDPNNEDATAMLRRLLAGP